MRKLLGVAATGPILFSARQGDLCGRTVMFPDANARWRESHRHSYSSAARTASFG